MNLRQTILLRTDLNLPMGLSESQCAHLHNEVTRQWILKNVQSDPQTNDGKWINAPIRKEFLEWLQTPYIFIHGIPNTESLEYYRKIAIEKGIEVTEWKDTVYLKVSEKQTIVIENCLVGITFGPADSDKIKAVIGDLPLLSPKKD